jgi:hypothetical protein
MDLLFQIKKRDGQPLEAEGDGSDSGSEYSSNASPFDHVSVYRQMLELMKPGESVAKSIQRLGELITCRYFVSFTIFCFFFCLMICIILGTKWTHGI